MPVEKGWRDERLIPVKAPLRVALFHPYSAFLDGEITGGGTYEKSALELLSSLRPQIDIIHFVPRQASGRIQVSSKLHGERVVPFKPTLLERWVASKPRSAVSRAVLKMGMTRTQNTLRKHSIDIAYFSSPSRIAMTLGVFPYIFTVWDTGHRDLPEFSEMASRREYGLRENLYQKAVPQALHVMVDSISTGRKLEKFYGLETDNWTAIGLLPRVEDVSISPTSIEGDYVIYPAARWPHKNHETLLEGMKEVLKDFPNLKLVLTGTDSGHGLQLTKMISQFGVGQSVVDLGFVSRSEVLGLIQGAKALVMPTRLGPTNLPPLEALALGTHAIVSDVHAFGTAVDDLLVKIPATDSLAWANKIKEILGEKSPEPFSFSFDEAIEAHLGVFQRFLESKPGSAS